jgi:hypothetical protein
MKPGMTPVFDVVGAGFNGLMSQTAIRNFGFTDQEPHRRHDRRNAREPAGAPTATSRSQRQISAIWSGPDRSDVPFSRAVAGATCGDYRAGSRVSKASDFAGHRALDTCVCWRKARVLRVAVELGTWRDVWVLLDALFELGDVVEGGCEHPAHVELGREQVDLLAGV